MHEHEAHLGDKSQDISNDDQENIVKDDGMTAEDTEKSSDLNKGEQSKQAQKMAWIKKIESGKVSLEEMPKNLGWLKKEIESEMIETPKKTKKEELVEVINKVLTEREASQEFDNVVKGLQDSDISAEQEARLKEEYEFLLEGSENPTEKQRLKALLIAKRLVGLKDYDTSVKERRHKGMSLPPLSGQRQRSTVEKDKETELEKRLSGGLPQGW